MNRKTLKIVFVVFILLCVLVFPIVAITSTVSPDLQEGLKSSVISEKGLTKSLEECPCNCPFNGTSSNELCISLCPFGGSGGINKYYTYRALTPNFSASATGGPVPLTVKFRDLSSSTMSRWLWDFGDGATSTEQNPIHTYEREGVYSVTLVLGGGHSDSITGAARITSGAWAGSISRGYFSQSSDTEISWTKKDYITVLTRDQPKTESLTVNAENKTILLKNVSTNMTKGIKNKTK